MSKFQRDLSFRLKDIVEKCVPAMLKPIVIQCPLMALLYHRVHSHPVIFSRAVLRYHLLFCPHDIFLSFILFSSRHFPVFLHAASFHMSSPLQTECPELDDPFNSVQ